MTDKTWTPVTLIKTTAEFLAGKGVPSPKLDAEVLLVHVLGLASRVGLYTEFDRPLTNDEVDRYRELVRRRREREPVNRILGECDFMGLLLEVRPEVFAPRPETEILVEESVKILTGSDRVTTPAAPVASDAGSEDPGSARVLDLCTGSGCIAVALATYCPRAYVVASDLSPAALTLARENAHRLGVWERMDFREGDMWEACWEGETFDLVLANPPYLVEGDPAIWPEVKLHDPAVALYGGVDGLDSYRHIAAEVMAYLSPGGHLVVEVGATQAAAVLDLFATTGLENLRTVKDYQQIDRVIVARKPGG